MGQDSGSEKKGEGQWTSEIFSQEHLVPTCILYFHEKDDSKMTSIPGLDS